MKSKAIESYLLDLNLDSKEKIQKKVVSRMVFADCTYSPSQSVFGLSPKRHQCSPSH